MNDFALLQCRFICAPTNIGNKVIFNASEPPDEIYYHIRTDHFSAEDRFSIFDRYVSYVVYE